MEHKHKVIPVPQQRLSPGQPYYNMENPLDFNQVVDEFCK